MDREINELLYASRRRGQQQQQQVQRAQANNAVLNSTNGEQPQRPIDPEDICPVCQETFASKLLPVTYCRSHFRFLFYKFLFLIYYSAYFKIYLFKYWYLTGFPVIF